MTTQTKLWKSLFGSLLVIAFLVGAGRLYADGLAINNVPSTITYQGVLSDSAGQPLNTDVALQFTLYDAGEGGNNLWSEVQKDVPVEDGRFAVEIGSVNPLSSEQFADSSRYLKIGVDQSNSGTNFSDLPRQKLSSVPFALRASSVAWAGLTDVPAGFADGVDDAGGISPENLVIVAKAGGDYTSITAAMNNINPSAANPYLVWVMPGTYAERVEVKPYVHLKGSGIDHTQIVFAVSSDNINQPDSALLIIPGKSHASDLTVNNTVEGAESVAVLVNGGQETSHLKNIRAIATGANGTRRVGLYLRSSVGTLSNVYADARNASIGNWGIFNSASSYVMENTTGIGIGNGNSSNGLRVLGGVPEIRSSVFRGLGGDAAYGIEYNAGGSETVYINHSVLEGDDLGLSSTNGNHRITIGGSEITGGGLVSTGTLFCPQSYDKFGNELNPNTCQ